MKFRCLLLLGLVAAVLAGCAGPTGTGKPVIKNAWARPGSAGQNGAIYFDRQQRRGRRSTGRCSQPGRADRRTAPQHDARFDSPPQQWYTSQVRIDSDYQYLAESCTADDLLAALVRASHSNTRARRAVLEALCEAGGQATPAQLLVLGRVHQPSLGLITVYRTLEILNDLGLVRKLHLDEGCSTYALLPASIKQTEGEPHLAMHASHHHSHHVICQRCRRATEFAGCDIDMVVAAVEAQTGYRVREHWLEMFGLCPACQAAEDAVAT